MRRLEFRRILPTGPGAPPKIPATRHTQARAINDLKSCPLPGTTFPGVYRPHQSAQGLPNASTDSPCSRPLSREKQQKMTRVNEGVERSASTVVVTAIFAARSAGNRNAPVEIAGNATEARLLSRQSSIARR